MTNEPRGCLAILFGVRGSSRPIASHHQTHDTTPTSEDEGNYHSGPGGYEGMGYAGGYAADYNADHDHFDEGEEH